MLLWMGKQDVLAGDWARRFAWRTAESVDVEAESEARAPREQAQATLDEARNRCEELAELVRRAWGMQDPGRQAQAAVALVERAIDVGLPVAAMPELEAMRLFRLVARHRELIDDDLLEEASAALSFLPLELDSELAPLIAEVVEADSEPLSFGLLMARNPPAQRVGELGVRLLPLLGPGAAYGQRQLAAVFARWARDASVLVPLLRQALSEPHLGLRACALSALLDIGGLEESDVQAMLDDLVEHPPVQAYGAERWTDRCHDYAESLHRAVARLPPQFGYRPLAAILRHECVFIDGQRMPFEDAFALRALAAAYPERAAPEIDRRLQESLGERYAAMRAAAELPEELALPRLARATLDCVWGIHEQAKKQLWKRCACEPPTFELPVPVEGTPSPRFTQRLTALRGPDEASRTATVRELLASSDPEALPLLLYALSHDFFFGTDLPIRAGDWATRLFESFGERAFDGMLVLAEPKARFGIDYSWVEALLELLRHDRLNEPQRDRFRALCERVLLEHPEGDPGGDVMQALGRLGTPASCIERAWALAFGPEQEPPDRTHRRYVTSPWAADALAGAGENRELDARTERELNQALERQDWRRASSFLRLLARRDAAGLPAATERCIEHGEREAQKSGSEQARDLAAWAVHTLRMTERLTEERQLGWLEDHDSLLFEAAARSVVASQERAVQALLRALESTARGGATAASAADALVDLGVLTVDDVRVDRALTQAPPEDRFQLLRSLVCRKRNIAGLVPHFIALLGQDDEHVAGSALDLLCFDTAQRPTVLEQALAQGVNPAVLDRVLQELGHPAPAAMYFLDSPARARAGSDPGGAGES